MSVDTPHCRFCDQPLTHTFIDLGTTPLANSYPSKTDLDRGGELRFPLHVRVCDACFLVQVSDSLPPEAIFSDYAYFSSYSDGFVAHAKAYADEMTRRFDLGVGSQVVEIASNDGYLLQHFVALGIDVLGVEPAANVAEVAVAKGVRTHVAFFGADEARALKAQGIAADLMAANNVLAHVPQIGDFAEGFAILLKPKGVATFEFPHLQQLIEQVQFDTIYHEHFSYLSLLAVETVFASVGLAVFDVEEIPTHGGSLRLYAARSDAGFVETSALQALRDKEREAGLDKISGYQGFKQKVEAARTSFLAFVADAKSRGSAIAAYGAAAKGATFLNYCGASAADIDCVFDLNPAKQGRYMPGTHIPILTPQRLADQRPDYLIILPWNIKEEVMRQTAQLRDWGGRFVIAIPATKIV